MPRLAWRNWNRNSGLSVCLDLHDTIGDRPIRLTSQQSVHPLSVSPVPYEALSIHDTLLAAASVKFVHDVHLNFHSRSASSTSYLL